MTKRERALIALAGHVYVSRLMVEFNEETGAIVLLDDNKSWEFQDPAEAEVFAYGYAMGRCEQ